MLIELQGLRAAHTEMMKYNSISRGGGVVVANNINNNNTMATAAATTTTTTPLATQSEGQHTAEERSGDNSRNSGDNIRNSGDNSRNTGDNIRNSGDNSRNTRPSLMVGRIGVLTIEVCQYVRLSV